MLGAICGDIIGSVHERTATKRADFRLFDREMRFTDDTVLTVATAHAILNDIPFDLAYREYGRRFPRSGFGSAFKRWLRSDDPRPYFSYGNGSAMRVSPVGWVATTEEATLDLARRSAVVTHDHPEGIRGAQAVALAVFLARTGRSKDEIRTRVTAVTGYDLTRSIERIRPRYRFDSSCQGSVPEAIIAFLESRSFEDSIRTAISLGGDADTQAAIAGAIAKAHFGVVPADIVERCRELLPDDFNATIDQFRDRFRDAPRTQ